MAFAQPIGFDQSILPIVGALLLLLIIVVVLFWRMSRKQRVEPTPRSAEPTKVIVPPPPRAPTAATLVFTKADGQQLSFSLIEPALSIGRAADNDIVVDDSVSGVDTVSKHHARLRRDQDDYLVRDLGSKNGLTVNGRQTLENMLLDGDRIGFGEVEAIFHGPGGGAS
jgi:hypothetical protein